MALVVEAAVVVVVAAVAVLLALLLPVPLVPAALRVVGLLP